MKSNYEILLLSASCIILLLINGFIDDEEFRTDTITIGLLILAFLPFLQKFLGSIKTGGVEVTFREYHEYKQILIFLDGISSRQEWTLYNPRSGEKDLGHGFKILIDDLVQNNRKELTDQIDKWFKSGSNCHKWFAAEIVGYAMLDKFKEQCRSFSAGLPADAMWDNWRLNCLWAYSRFDQYRPLISGLEECKNEYNRKWMIGACRQMVNAEEDPNILSELNKVIEKFSS